MSVLKRSHIATPIFECHGLDADMSLAKLQDVMEKISRACLLASLVRNEFDNGLLSGPDSTGWIEFLTTPAAHNNGP